ncbi:phage integrase [Nitrobacter hamburgensis X14]|uniref:Phage integrase n=2 Tax=Nitrobacter hamburgensis TaxID=912 RepID=Q1QRG5_NITHX|nr:phage integrase [Nitrobacter hamburgensis X14]
MVSLKRSMTTRARSALPQFRVRVPATVVDSLRVLLYLSERAGPPFAKVVKIGETVEFSLGTTDSVVPAARQDDALDHLRRLFDLTATIPVQLSHRDMVALSGETYRLYIKANEENPGEPMAWRMHKALHRAVVEGRIANPPPATLSADDATAATDLFGSGDLTAAVNALPAGQHDGLEDRFGLLADWVLIRSRLNLTTDDRRRFLQLVGTASLDASWQLRRNSEGDYSPDPKAARFPAMETVTAGQPRQTITGLFDLWWTEAKALGRSQSTHDGYKNGIDRLVEFLEHDDAKRITADDALRFKDHCLKTVTPKTFRDADLPGLKSVFGWGLTNRKIAANTFATVTIKREKKIVVRSPGFTDEEAAAIFRHCLAYQHKPKENAKTAAAKRWGPLIAAYTSCRIAEALQLRKADVFEESGYSVMRFTPEAGSIKTGIYRLVPIHSHLIDLGFLIFVDESSDGPLFATGSYKRVFDFVRGVVTDPNVQPNHGWRHRLKTVARNLGLDPRVVDAIQGHAARTASDGYGDVSVVAMALVMDKILRYRSSTRKMPGPRKQPRRESVSER